jgi:hypothetical protein
MSSSLAAMSFRVDMDALRISLSWWIGGCRECSRWPPGWATDLSGDPRPVVQNLGEAG